MSPPQDEWVREIFENENNSVKFKSAGHAGGGAQGTVYKFREVDQQQQTQRTVAVKYALNENQVSSLEKEITIAEQLGGYVHFAQPILNNGKMFVPENIPEEHPKQKRTFLLTGFIRGITLEDFIIRKRSRFKPPTETPNRILWSIFMCLVRMTVGLARPPEKNANLVSSPILEPLPKQEPTPSDKQIYHGDLSNSKNFVFGDLDADEHNLVPILKTIDFGDAINDHSKLPAKLSELENVTADTITQGNIYHVGVVMQQLYDHFKAKTEKDFFEQRKNLDKDLYDLVGRCVSKSHRDRPTLKELFTAVQNAIKNKTGPGNFQGKLFAEWESDEKIREYVQEMILAPRDG